MYILIKALYLINIILLLNNKFINDRIYNNEKTNLRRIFQVRN